MWRAKVSMIKPVWLSCVCENDLVFKVCQGKETTFWWGISHLVCADRDWRKLKHVHVIGCSFAGVYCIRTFTNCQYLVITKVSKITKYRVSVPFWAGGKTTSLWMVKLSRQNPLVLHHGIEKSYQGFRLTFQLASSVASDRFESLAKTNFSLARYSNIHHYIKSNEY